MSNFQAICRDIHDANPERCVEDAPRRFVKYYEELGEMSQAFLSITARNNHRNMTWDDFREEAVDTLILAIDLALTPYDDDLGQVISSRSIIPSMLNASATVSLNDYAGVEERIMAVGQDISRAFTHFRDENYMSFHGAMARVIQNTADLAFHSLDEKSMAETTTEVREILDRKLTKWAALRGAPTPQVTEVAIDTQKNYMEDLQDRHAS